MEHTNPIAVRVLTREHNDYPRNAWHYDREYKMIIEALELEKLASRTIEEGKSHYEILRGCLWFAPGEKIPIEKAYEYFTPKAIRSLLKDGMIKLHYKTPKKG